MGKHFSKSYQPNPAAQATLAPQEQQLSKTHSKKNTNVLSVNKFLDLPERQVNALPHCSYYQRFPKEQQNDLKKQDVHVWLVRTEEFMFIFFLCHFR